MTAESKNNVMITRRQALALTGGRSSPHLRSIGRAGVWRERAGEAYAGAQRNAAHRLWWRPVPCGPVAGGEGAYPGFEGTANSHLRNPLVPLPMPHSALVGLDVQSGSSLQGRS
jgi:hypothetical protein